MALDHFEKINRAFGSWYEGLFGSSSDVRPRDILRKILATMEEFRKEGIDNRIYVPNQYILEISVDDPDEKDYLLSFLDRDELETAIRKYCDQNHYVIRGALDFTIQEVESLADQPKREKVRVRCKYIASGPATPAESPQISAVPSVLDPVIERLTGLDDDPATVAQVVYGNSDELGTVPSVAHGSLTINSPGKPSTTFPVHLKAITIGRSERAGNDIVLTDDGMASRRHARIELDRDGRFTIYDLDTTNGTKLNGRKIDNSVLNSGDEIQIGNTKIVFNQTGTPNSDAASSVTSTIPFASTPLISAPRIVVVLAGKDVDTFVLGTESAVGRGLTNDVVLTDRSIGMKHARIITSGEPRIEQIDSEHSTTVNQASVVPGSSYPLRNGDLIGIGSVTVRYEAGA